MIVCKVCGSENEQGATFCGTCGSFLEWSGESVGGEKAAGDAAAAGTVAGAAGAASAGGPPGPPGGPVPTGSSGPPGPGPDDATVVAGPPPGGGTPPPGGPQAAPPGSIVCPVCGQVNDASRVFCSRCATELAPATAVAPVSAEPPQGRNVPTAALLGGIGAIAVLGVLAFVFLLPKGSPTPSSAASDTASAQASLAAASVPASAGASGGASAAPSAGASAPASAPPSSGPSARPALTGLVVFSADKNGDADLWVWDPATNKSHRLLKAPGGQSDPAWSPEGDAVVYRNPDGLRMVMADGKPADPPDFTHHAQDRHPAWSPDGKTVVFATDRQPFNNLEIATRVANDNTADLVRLTDNNADDWDPQWSPDGKRLVFVSTRGGHQHLWTMDSDGSQQKEVPLGPGIYDDPMWSPDGQWFGFTRREANTPKALYIARTDGSQMRRLTSSGVEEDDLAWSPDGSTIAIVRRDNANLIRLVDVATGEDVGSFGVQGAVNRAPDWWWPNP